jgi:hypothetical protein
MSATYSGNPKTSPKDEVRFLIFDTNMKVPMLQDEEIQYQIDLVFPKGPPASGNYLAAAYCCDVLRAKFAATSDSESIGDLTVARSSQAQRFADMSARLRQRATLAGVKVWAGGTSVAEKKGPDADPDRVQPAFRVNGMSMIDPNSSETGGSSGPEV